MQAVTAFILLVTVALSRLRGSQLAGSASISVDMRFEYQASQGSELEEPVKAAVSSSAKVMCRGSPYTVIPVMCMPLYTELVPPSPRGPAGRLGA